MQSKNYEIVKFHDKNVFTLIGGRPKREIGVQV